MAKIAEADLALKEILDAYAPLLCDLPGVGVEVASQLLVTMGDNLERVGNEAQFAALAGVAPIPASSGKTSRHRLSRGGDRNANKALHHVVLVRMGSDARTKEYVAKRTLEGKGKREIMRCLKRYVARELYRQIMNPAPAPSITDLRPLRTRLGLTLQNAAEHLNQWPSYLSRLERGQTRNDTLIAEYRQWLNDQERPEKGPRNLAWDMKTPAVTDLPAWLREMPGAGARTELDVEDFLPRPFAAYCRILNPARSVAGESLPWRDLSDNTDAVDGATQWADLQGSAQRHEALHLDPVMGGLDTEVARVLSGILSRHTGTPEQVAYLAWEGYADLDERYSSAGTVWASYGRKMHLLHGTLAEASSAASAHQDAPLWWVPSDGSWCVGNDIYARSVYVGGSRDCIQEILENHNLESYPVRPEQKVAAEDY